jgi:hypothetical protein
MTYGRVVTKGDYHHFYSGTMNPCDINRQFHELAKTTWLCPGCFSPRPDVEAVDIKIDGRKPYGKFMTAAHGVFVPMVSQLFLDYLPKDLVKREFFIGRLIDPSDRPIDGWFTARCRSHVIIRGTKHAGVRRCPECGRSVYFGGLPRYLSPAPPAGHEIHESHLCGFILTETLAEKVQIPKLRGVIHERLKVRIPAPDGLGDLPWRTLE